MTGSAGQGMDRQTMREIAHAVPILTEGATGEDVHHLFKDRPDLLFVIITDTQGRAVGLIDRPTFNLRVSGPYGYSLYQRRPATLLMDPRPMIVNAMVLVADFLPHALASSVTSTSSARRLLNGFIVVDQDRPLGVGTALDLTRHEHAAKETALAELQVTTGQLREASERILRDKLFIDHIIQNVPSPILVRSAADGAVVLMNQAARQFGDQALTEAIASRREPFRQARDGEGDDATVDLSLPDLDGQVRNLAVRRQAITDPSGIPLWELYVCNDITVFRENERKIERIAYYDAVTGLANRRLLHNRLNELCAGNEPVVLFYIDLDYFKAVNDRHGHAVGDTLLGIVAQRLQHHSRQGDIVARIGGDEFAILWPNAASPGEINIRIAPLLTAIRAPCRIDGHMIAIGASIGCARLPEDAGSAEELLQHADQAMYRAKKLGRNQFIQFGAVMMKNPDMAC